MIAYANNFREIIDILESKGALRTIKDNMGRTA
jgi:hypothetical protein